MKVLFAVSEAMPFCTTGGLGDAAGNLVPALARADIETTAIMPLYQSVKSAFSKELELIVSNHIYLSWRKAQCNLYKLVKDNVTWYFIENDRYFDRDELYGYDDDAERFAFFSRAVVSSLMYLDDKPDVIQCNDWQTALIPVYLRADGEREPWVRSIRTVLTIHDIRFQGTQSISTLGDLFGLQNTCVDDGTMIMHGDVNMLKGGIECANSIVIVSPTYAEEIKLAYFGCGLESIMQKNSFKTVGILDGIDETRYDPAIDKYLSVNYNVASVEERHTNKHHLQRVMSLRRGRNIPVIGIISKLSEDYGFDILCEAFGDIVNLGVQLVIIGQGNTKYENFFRWASEQYPGSVGYKHGYSLETISDILGGADFFLAPSKIEPCGLAHMAAMKYGAVPIVRETGGLKDTVSPYESMRDIGTGFTFGAYTPGDLVFCITQALEVFRNNKQAFRLIQKKAMAQDFSIAHTAEQYKTVYESLSE